MNCHGNPLKAVINEAYTKNICNQQIQILFSEQHENIKSQSWKLKSATTNIKIAVKNIESRAICAMGR